MYDSDCHVAACNPLQLSTFGLHRTVQLVNYHQPRNLVVKKLNKRLKINQNSAAYITHNAILTVYNVDKPV